MLGISFWLSMSWAFYHLNLKGFLLLQPEWDDAEVTRYQRLRRLKPLVPGTLIIQWLLKKCISHLGHSLLSDSPPWLLPEYWLRSWAASVFSLCTWNMISHGHCGKDRDRDGDGDSQAVRAGTSFSGESYYPSPATWPQTNCHTASWWAVTAAATLLRLWCRFRVL